MPQADGSSAAVEPNEHADLRRTVVAGGWREGTLVMVMVLAPLGLAIILVAIGVFAIAGWQIARGVAVELPTSASIRPYGLLAYAAASWIDVAAVRLWSSRRGLSREIFLFRRLTRRRWRRAWRVS